MVGALLGDLLALGEVATMAKKDQVDVALAKAQKLIEERQAAGEATPQDRVALKHVKAAAAWRAASAGGATKP